MQTPLIPMTAITGRPTEDSVFEYMRKMKDSGIDRVLLYPRSGCEVEYLSEDWFRTVGSFVSAARRLDMRIWLYDDFNWPSGDACGRVTAVPAYRLRAISTKGPGAGTVTVRSRHNAGLFGEKYFPDLLSFAAVEAFIGYTHEEYARRFGSDLGGVICGIYTDEPSIGYCCEEDRIPYYDGLEADYRARYGRDFRSELGSPTPDFYRDAMALVSDRFYHSYISRLSSWCEAHHLILTGHLMCDDDPFYAVRHSGHFLKNLSALPLPGIDELATDLGGRNEAALFGVAEYAGRERGAMAELFALGPCDMIFARRRQMLYFAACHKINHYFLAVAPLDLRGNRLVTDYFSDFSPDSPDFDAMRLLGAEARAAACLAGKDYRPDVYVRYPFDVAARRITEPLNTAPFFHALNSLNHHQLQWKFIDGEDPEGIPVLEVGEDLTLTLSGEPFDPASMPVKPTVTDANGLPPEGIFVRRFTDGTTVVLNLCAPPGTYELEGEPIRLEEHGVLLSPPIPSRQASAEIAPRFSVAYSTPNMIRTMYVNGRSEATVRCEEALTLTLAVREDAEARWEGEAVSCPHHAELLPRGMRALYRVSDPMVLPAGEYTLAVDRDDKYLPGVLILGDFLSETVDPGDVILTCRRQSCSVGEWIPGYGTASFTATVTVPFGAVSLEAAGSGLYTLAELDGRLLGADILSPAVFPIPSELWGREVTLCLTQHSSIGPIFGNVDCWDRLATVSQWRGTPSTAMHPFGISRLCWRMA